MGRGQEVSFREEKENELCEKRENTKCSQCCFLTKYQLSIQKKNKRKSDYSKGDYESC